MGSLKVSFVILLLYFAGYLNSTLLTTGSSSLSLPPSYQPQPNPASVVSYGHARFTFLTESMVRIQYSKMNSSRSGSLLHPDGGNNHDGSFDDLATFAVVNRYLPSVSYTITHLNSTSIMINTSSLTIIYDDNVSSSEGNTCNPVYGMDQSGGVRVTEYPDGTHTDTLSLCCVLCQSLPDCNTYVYHNNSLGNSTNCWLLTTIGRIISSRDRFMGNVTHTILPGKNLRIYMNNNTLIPSSSSTGQKQPYNINSFVWTPDTLQTGSLNGTYSHLDCYTTPTECYDWSWQQMNQSLLSTLGWTLWDDSANSRLVPSTNTSIDGGIPMYANATINTIDWYFYQYNNFREALSTWKTILGTQELVARPMLGTFWSQNYPWTNQSTNFSIVTGVLDNYYNYEIPLSVLVLDMDWHNRHEYDPLCATWGSWDFNLTAYPDPQQFIDYIHSTDGPVGHPLMLALNVHPQTGVDHCMVKYNEIARLLDFDTSTNATIPCDMGNRSFVNALWSVYYHSEPLLGMDFAWTDYTGCGNYPVNSLLWSNLVYAWERNTINNQRPIGFSRNGGIGNHRVPIGFSGDTFQHELTLDFEIQTTSLAANSLFGYWSHDIGGFHSGSGAPGTSNTTNTTGAELYLRWLQFASVAPIFRTHCGGCGPDPPATCQCDRRIWLFTSHFYFMRDAFRLRNALLPYIYNAAKYSFDTGISFVRPLYLDYQEYMDTIQLYPHQYNFGSDIIVSPISGSMNGNIYGSISKSMWIPPGNWSQFRNGTVVTGSMEKSNPTIDNRMYRVNDIPMFIKTGSIIPLATNNTANIASTSPGLMWMMYAQSKDEVSSTINNNVTVYEDDGQSTAYYANNTTVAVYTESGYRWDTNKNVLYYTVNPSIGTYSTMPVTRSSMALQIRGYTNAFSTNPTQILINNQPATPSSGSGEGCILNCWYIMMNLDIYQSLVYPEGSLNIVIGENIPLNKGIQIEVHY